MTWQLIDYNGKLAVTLGWSDYNEEPVRTRPVWVHPTEKWSDYYTRFTQVTLRENNYFMCFDSQTYQSKPLYTEGWQMINEEEPIKPPSRGGKDWRWVWSGWSHKYIKEYC